MVRICASILGKVRRNCNEGSKGADHAGHIVIPNPAAPRFRGLDLEAMTALQMHDIDAIRRMANLMFDSMQAITERQDAFLKSGVRQMNAAFESGDGASGPKAIFERQTEAYRDLFSVLVTHVGDLSEITSKCCAGLVQEAARNLVVPPQRGK